MSQRIKNEVMSWRSAICEAQNRSARRAGQDELEWLEENAGALSAPEKHTAITLSLYMSERGDSAFPSVGTLAEDTGLSRRAVQAALKRLVELGWLLEVERGGVRGGRRRATEYRATFPPKGAGDAPVEDAAEVMTGAGGARVQEMHGCTSRPRRVQENAPKGAGDAPHEFKKSHEELLGAEAPGEDPQKAIAKDLADRFWKITNPKPVAGYMAVRQRLTEALEAGYTADQLWAILPTLKVFSRNGFDLALRSTTPPRLEPAPPDHDDCPLCGGTGWVPDFADELGRSSLRCPDLIESLQGATDAT